MNALLAMLRRRANTFVALAIIWLLASCNHPDKPAAIRQIEQDTGCTFLKEGSTHIEGDKSSTGPPGWVFKGVLYSKNLAVGPLPVIWVVPEYPSKYEVTVAYRLALSEAEVIEQYLEAQKQATP